MFQTGYETKQFEVLGTVKGCPGWGPRSGTRQLSWTKELQSECDDGNHEKKKNSILVTIIHGETNSGLSSGTSIKELNKKNSSKSNTTKNYPSIHVSTVANTTEVFLNTIYMIISVYDNVNLKFFIF